MRLLLISVLVLSVTACGIVGGKRGPFRDRQMDYQKVETLDRITLPAGIEFLGEHDLYSVPDADQRIYFTGEKMDVPEPPKMVILGAEQEVQPEEGAPMPENTSVVLARDGNGHPIIMVSTQFYWAWEMVKDALAKTDLKEEDRNRESGIFFIRLPKKGYDVENRDVQIKLSHTVNGIQIVVLNNKGTALLDKGPAQDILQLLYDQL